MQETPVQRLAAPDTPSCSRWGPLQPWDTVQTQGMPCASWRGPTKIEYFSWHLLVDCLLERGAPACPAPANHEEGRQPCQSADERERHQPDDEPAPPGNAGLGASLLRVWRCTSRGQPLTLTGRRTACWAHQNKKVLQPVPSIKQHIREQAGTAGTSAAGWGDQGAERT